MDPSKNQQLPSDGSFYQSGGTLPYAAPSYVERDADRELFDALCRGEFCCVLTSRQVGKSSLMVRTASQLTQNGVYVVLLDLTSLGRNLTAEQWYWGLLDQMGRQLGLADELERFWQEHPQLGPLHRWMRALQDVVLTSTGSRPSATSHPDRDSLQPGEPGHSTPAVVVFLDEIDTVRRLPFGADELFAALRECHNRRTQDSELNRLAFCLLGVATPADLAEDTRTTPFNIGRQIELTDFTQAEAAPLAGGLRTDERTADKLLQRVLYWTSGQPYLTQRLCRAVAEQIDRAGPDRTGPGAADVDRLCMELFLSTGARSQDNNLLFVRERLLRSQEDRADLLEVYARVRRGKWVRYDETSQMAGILKLAGLVRVVGGTLRLRNRIYAHVFDLRWVREHMPDAELKRQRVAYRRGLLRAATVAAMIVLTMATLALTAMSNSQRAQAASVEAGRKASELQVALIERNRAVEELQTTLSELKVQRSRAEREAGRATWSSRREREQRLRADAARLQSDQRRREAQQQRRIAMAGRTEAEWQRTRAERQQQLAVVQKREADRQREEGRQRLVQLQVANGWRMVHDGDLLGSLPWFVEALKLDHLDPARDELHRMQLAAVLRRCPTLVQAWPHSAPVFHAEFSRDGRRVVTATNDGVVQAWDTVSGHPIGPPIRHQTQVGWVAFSPDGRRVATVSGKTAQLWDVGTGRPAAPPIQPGRALWTVSFSPDGRRVTTGSGGSDGGPDLNSENHGAVQVWDADTSRALTPPLEHAAPVINAAFSPDGRRIVSTSGDGTSRIWDAVTGEPVTAPLAHRSDGGRCESHARFSPDGRRVVSTSMDSVARVWDVTTGRPMVLITDIDAVRSAEFSPDGELVVTAGNNGMTRVWSAETGQPITPALKNGPGVGQTNVAFSPDGSRILASNAETVQVWDSRTGVAIGPPLKHNGAVRAAAFSPDGLRIVTACSDHVARVWSLATPSPVISSEAHGFLGASFSPDARRVVAAGRDGTARVWDASTGRLLLSLGKSHRCVSTAFSPDGRLIVTASSDHTARIWDATTGASVAPPLPHGDEVLTAAFSPDNRRVVTGCKNGAARVWDVVTGRALTAPLQHRDRILRVSFSLDGRRIVAAGGDYDPDRGEARVWDASTGTPVTPPLRHPRPVHRAAFSPDGRWLLTGDGTRLRVWDARTGLPAQQVPRLGTPVLWTEFSPDGRRLVSVSNDRTARVWDARGTLGQARPITPLLRYHRHRYMGELSGAEFRDEGRLVATWGVGGAPVSFEAHLWDAGTGELVAPPFHGDGFVWTAAVSPDGRRVLTANQDGAAAIWDLSRDNRPLQELARQARLLSGSRIDETGGLVPLTAAELQSDWRSAKEGPRQIGRLRASTQSTTAGQSALHR